MYILRVYIIIRYCRCIVCFACFAETNWLLNVRNFNKEWRRVSFCQRKTRESESLISYWYTALKVVVCIHIIKLCVLYIMCACMCLWCRLCELNEHIEILDAALDYKSRSIDARQPGLRVALEHEVSYEQAIKRKLETLTPTELHDLLLRWNAIYTIRCTKSSKRKKVSN